ncbi:MAG TPA: extracellular solute-binding protein, partial [Mycobacteriales bacterium]|nr:extracellular solute-binding protein [Mycobacteriales bacterium]
RYVNDETGNLKVDTSLQGGVEIDIVVSYSASDVAKRVGAGLFVDISGRIAAESQFAPFAVGGKPQSNYIFGGKAYTIPAAATPSPVMMNQSMLDAKKITVPDAWTTDDFRGVCKKLSGSNTFGTFTTPDLARQTLGPNDTYKAGGKASNYDDPVFSTSMQLNVDMIKDRSALPETQILAQKLQVYPQSVFLTGKVGMLINTAYLLRYINDTKNYPHDFKTLIKPVPVPAKNKKYWDLGAYGDFLAITKRSKNQDAAWTLIKWWMTEGAQYMVQGGRLPSMAGMPQDAIMSALLGQDAAKLYDVDSATATILAPGKKIPLDTITTAAAEMSTITTSLNQQCLLGKMSVADWAKQSKQQCDAAIKKNS